MDVTPSRSPKRRSTYPGAVRHQVPLRTQVRYQKSAVFMQCDTVRHELLERPLNARSRVALVANRNQTEFLVTRTKASISERNDRLRKV